MRFGNDLYKDFPLAFLLKMQTVYDTLKKAERRAADYILAHPFCLSSMTISDLAREADCSNPTLIRLARRLGYDGFLDFKNQFNAAQALMNSEDSQSSSYEYSDYTESDTPAEIASKMANNVIQDLSNFLAVFDQTVYAQAVSCLRSANHICFFGVGDSDIVASYGYNNCVRNGLSVSHTADPDLMIALASNLSRNDAAIVISHSGKSSQLLNVVKLLNTLDIPIILVTNFPGTQMAKLASIVLLENSFQTEKHAVDEISCRLIQMLIVESLIVNISTIKPAEKRKTDYRQAINAFNKVE